MHGATRRFIFYVMFVYCVVRINHNRQHRSCPYVPPTKCASVRKRKFVPSKSECVPLLHDNSHFLFTVSYFSYDASYSEYSSRLSVKLLSRSHKLRPLTISFLRLYLHSFGNNSSDHSNIQIFPQGE